MIAASPTTSPTTRTSLAVVRPISLYNRSTNTDEANAVMNNILQPIFAMTNNTDEADYEVNKLKPSNTNAWGDRTPADQTL